MKLLDSIDKNLDVDFSIPREVRLKMEVQRKARNDSIANRLAFQQLGVNQFLVEEQICEDYGITKEQLRYFKQKYKDQIEQHKQRHFIAKSSISSSIAYRNHLSEEMAKARISGDMDLYKVIKSVLKDMEEVIPATSLVSMANALRDMNEVVGGNGDSAANIQINVNPAIQEAERILEAKKKERIVKVSSLNGKSDNSELE